MDRCQTLEWHQKVLHNHEHGLLQPFQLEQESLPIDLTILHSRQHTEQTHQQLQLLHHE